MNRFCSFLFFLTLSAAFLFCQTAVASLFYDPIVTVVGNGTTPVSGTGYTTAIHLYKHSLAAQAAPTSSVAYNDGTSGLRLVNSATATSEASLTNNPGLADLAAKGLPFVGTGYAYSAGYDAANVTANVNSSGTNANRSVGRVDVAFDSVTNARVIQTHPQAGAYNNNNIRGATGGDSSDDLTVALYTAGTGSTGATAGWRDFRANTQLPSGTLTNVRTVEALGGRLFGSTGSGAVGIYLLDPLGVNPASLYIGTGSGRSPYEFALFNDTTNLAVSEGFNVAYIADDSASFGGIQKWTFDGSAWTQAYTLREPGITYRGLAGQRDPISGLVTLFATTGETSGNRLVQVTDTGPTASFTTLATAPSGYIFRGAALAPVPEPGTLALLLGAAGVCGLLVLRRQ